MTGFNNFLVFLAQSASEAAGSAAANGGEAAAGEAGAMGFLSNPKSMIIMLPLLLILMMSMGGGNRKKQKEMQKLLNSLEKGDKVQSIGGIIGTVSHLKEGSVVVKVNDNSKMEFAASAIATVLVKKNAPATPVAPEKGGFLNALKERIGGKKESAQDVVQSDNSASAGSADAGSEDK